MPRRPLLSLLLLAFLVSVAPAADDHRPATLTPWQLRSAVAAKPTGKDLDQLREQVTATFGKKDLEGGSVKPKVEDTLACWAILADKDKTGGKGPRVVQTDGDRHWDMQPLAAGEDIYLAFADLPNCTDLTYAYEVGGKQMGKGQLRIETYNYGPDSYPHDDVPKGKITRTRGWKSKVFADTVRDFSVYVPAQYDPDGPPACVMVFQDGDSYLGDQFRTAAVFDNLIHKKEIPVIVGIFINPGVIPQENGKPPVSNRSFEYDTLSDQYARFLRDEILPEVGKTVHLRRDPGSRAICGISSGGICAFTVAWETPDQFGKVLSHVGSFTNIRGGDVYPGRIRKTAKKDIRVYLQDGERDLDNEHGNWPLANRQMAAALRFKGYDCEFDMGPGFHSGKYGGAHLPEEMRWLWRDYQPKGE